MHNGLNLILLKLRVLSRVPNSFPFTKLYSFISSQQKQTPKQKGDNDLFSCNAEKSKIKCIEKFNEQQKSSIASKVTVLHKKACPEQCKKYFMIVFVLPCKIRDLFAYTDWKDIFRLICLLHVSYVDLNLKFLSFDFRQKNNDSSNFILKNTEWYIHQQK